MSSINPKLYQILDESGVPQGQIDGAVIKVGEFCFRATQTNIIAHCRLQMTTPVDMTKLQQRIPSAKKKKDTTTFQLAIPKGSLVIQHSEATNISVNLNGSESKYSPPLHAHMLAMCLCMDNNPTIPSSIKVVHCGISLACTNVEPEDTHVKHLDNVYSGIIGSQFEESEIPGCQMYIGTSDKSATSATIFSNMRAISLGVNVDECDEYMVIICRLMVHMYQLSSGV